MAEWAPLAIKKALEIAEREGWLDHLKDALRTKHRILVLGVSGAGKTSVLESLKSAAPVIISAMNRTEFVTRNRLAIESELFEFDDTPGQALHRTRRVDAYRRGIREGHSGIINVVAYGYHETGSLSREAIKGGTVDDDFLRTRRDEEVAAIHEWQAIFQGSSDLKWVLTLVNKADLWWSSRDQVMDHYRGGDYATALGPLPSSSVLGYSCFSQRYFGVLPIDGTFDESQRRNQRDYLAQTLLAAVASLG